MLIVAITIVGLVLAQIIGLFIASLISKRIKEVLNFVEILGNGDLTKSINIKSKDEIGAMSEALNASVEKIRTLVSDITSSSDDISVSSEELTAATQEIYAKMENANEATKEIFNGVQDLRSVTEEVSVSTFEIQDTANELFHRANYALESVKEMIQAISKIAADTNLLALNAAIEAARAGEYGKGFAVVADKVKKLAEESKETVTNIQQVVVQIEDAINDLSKSGSEVLDYIVENVIPTYKLLWSTGVQYDKDAKFIENLAEKITYSSNQMKEVIGQVTEAIENVSATAHKSAVGSEEILVSVNEASSAIKEVSKASQTQAELAIKLNEMILQFVV
ncbi:MAG: methyl-accepting chemotaxis protein [Bacillota bacterium]|nr:methyl-accepting chemotaxis protein [Bacillota bacterium]